jgi:hypothetical protein
MRIREEVKDDEIVTFVLGGDVAGLPSRFFLAVSLWARRKELPSPGVVSRAIDQNADPFDPSASMEKVGADEEPPLPPGPYLKAGITEPQEHPPDCPVADSQFQQNWPPHSRLRSSESEKSCRTVSWRPRMSILSRCM